MCKLAERRDIAAVPFHLSCRGSRNRPDLQKRTCRAFAFWLYDRVVKSFVDASEPLEAGGTLSGSGCITSQR